MTQDEQGAAEAATSTYVIQVQSMASGSWHDVATVTVPARTQRRTVLKQALDGMDDLPSEGSYVRALDADSAAATPFGLEPQPAKLVIG